MSDKFIKGTIIFSCVFLFLEFGYSTLIHYLTFDINRTIFGVLFMSFFLFSIYKTARYEKNKLDQYFLI